MKIRIGYVTVSNRVMLDGERVGFLYRETPDDPDDSGWRVFSGDESQAYADDPSNFALYNASTMIGIEPALAEIIATPPPSAFERRGDAFVRVESQQVT